jgi:hypothetical protein
MPPECNVTILSCALATCDTKARWMSQKKYDRDKLPTCCSDSSSMYNSVSMADARESKLSADRWIIWREMRVCGCIKQRYRMPQVSYFGSRLWANVDDVALLQRVVIQRTRVSFSAPSSMQPIANPLMRETYERAGCSQYVRACMSWCIYLTNVMVDHAFAAGFNSWNHLFTSSSIFVSLSNIVNAWGCAGARPSVLNVETEEQRRHRHCQSPWSTVP